jgi:parallel beta-helix repeat protein
MKKKVILGIILVLIVSIFDIPFNSLIVEAVATTIWIYPDGSIYPKDAPIAHVGNVYTLIADIHGWDIFVEGGVSNIVIDGNGHTISSGRDVVIGLGGAGMGTIVVSGVTIKNTIIKENDGIGIAVNGYNNIITNNTIVNNTYGGIDLCFSGNTVSDNTIMYNKIDGVSISCVYGYTSSGNTITGNLISNNDNAGISLWTEITDTTIIHNTILNNTYDGIYLEKSSGNTISDNKVLNNTRHGVYLYDFSTDNVITDNRISNNGDDGIHLHKSSDHNTISSNTILNNGDDGIYLEGSNGNTITSENTLANNNFGISLSASSSNTISDNMIVSNTNDGIYLSKSSNDNTISGNTISNNGDDGIALSTSSGNTITNNNILNNNDDGIDLSTTSDANTISDNTILENNRNGVLLVDSSNNNIVDNAISKNSEDGIAPRVSKDEIVSRNLISENGHNGIEFYMSSDCTITNNNIMNNTEAGICLILSTGNTFHHNFIICNRIPAMGDGVNAWDDGKEGNYWGDYNGTDSDGDGIGDTPYIINANNKDCFPLMWWIRIAAPASLTSNYGWGTTQKGVFWPVDHEWIDRLGVIRISSIAYLGEVIVRGDTITYKDTVKHLYVAEPDKPYEPKLEISVILQPGRSIDVPIFHGCKSKEPVPETCLFQIKVTTVEDCPKTYTAGIEIHWVGMEECANGHKIVTGMTAEFRTIVEGGSWTYLKSDVKLPPGWSYSVDPPNGTLFETPYMVTLRITAAQNAKEGDIGIVTLSAFSNETKLILWRFVYFAALDSAPPKIEAVQPPISHPEGLTINAVVKDLVTGIDSVQLFYSLDDGPWKNQTMDWYSGDTFNSTTFAVTIPPIPKDSLLRYYIVTIDWLGNQAQSEVQTYIARARDWWPMFHHDLKHTGHSTSTAPNNNQILWSYTTGDVVFSSPAVADGKVFVGSWDNKVYALDENTGSLIWSYTTGGWVESCPAVADGKVFVGSDDKKVYALNENTGSLIWNYTIGGWVDSSPAVADGKVFIGSEDGNVFAFGGARTLASDLNGDGKVDILDIFAVARAFGSKPGDPNWNQAADLDNNGVINILDIFLVALNFGKTY